MQHAAPDRRLLAQVIQNGIGDCFNGTGQAFKTDQSASSSRPRQNASCLRIRPLHAP